MRPSMHLAYLSLVSVTCISSCFLLLAVVTGSTELVAEEYDAASTKQTLTFEPNSSAAIQATTATVQNTATTPVPHEKVLPNYKKVRKSRNLAAKQALLPEANARVPQDEPPTTVVEHVTAGLFTSNAVSDTPNVVDIAEESVIAATAENEAFKSDLSDKESQINVNVVHGSFITSKVPGLQSEIQEETAKQESSVETQQQETINEEAKNSAAGIDAPNLPDITEIPPITVTEVPLELLQPTHANIDALVIDAAKESIARKPENRTLELLENGGEQIRSDEQLVKFDDSGGDKELLPVDALIANDIPKNIPDSANNNVSATYPTTPAQEQQDASSHINTDNTTIVGNKTSGTVNLTVEEVPIPVFSEWAQKQMEAAEKQQALEQEVVNTSAQRKNQTNGTGKVPLLKIRNKNYASPDCGAKIIASNSDATNTGAVLSSSKDEYMLSPCGNRIWFVVELCEAIQAQKVELANFELFSSSPKNFTIAVSNRFPTRDWSNVGRFIAEDKRNVQSFDLHPHLFGKFVRVDIHSHYSMEHFCPVSLFRVFGTSEFEAFETENQPHMDMDDFEDEFAQEQAHAAKNTEQNLFKSASDAVMSIVKKAAEALGKPTNNLNATLTTQRQPEPCRTPTTGQFSCAECNHSLVDRINNVLSCDYRQIQTLLQLQWLRRDMLKTQICAKQFGIETRLLNQHDCSDNILENPLEMDAKRSYYLNMLPIEYIGALCQTLATQHLHKSPTSMPMTDDEAEPTLNLTIDKKLKKDDFKIVGNNEKGWVAPKTAYTAIGEDSFCEDGEAVSPTVTIEQRTAEMKQLPQPPQKECEIIHSTTLAPPSIKEAIQEVNMFNIPEKEQEKLSQESNEILEGSAEGSFGTPEDIGGTVIESSTEAVSSDNVNAKSDEDVASWEGIDHLLASTTATPNDIGTGNTAGMNLQAKIPSVPQSESVFIRLSNRIKALERNMSLSGQYLEELSRRYKKQVEELQLMLTQQVQSTRLLEEQNHRQTEMQHLLAQRNTQLKEELDDLSLQVHACIVVIVFVGAIFFFVFLVSILMYRTMRRQTKEVLALYGNGTNKKPANDASEIQRKLKRRKSYEDFSENQQNSEKIRRPSEEALMILKDHEEDTINSEIENVGDFSEDCPSAKQRERKISICYNRNGRTGTSNNCSKDYVKPNACSKRRGEKHSWPNSAHTQQQARQHLAQLQSPSIQSLDHHVNNKEGDASKRQPNTFLANGHTFEVSSKSGKTRKKLQKIRRHESTPEDFAKSESLKPDLSTQINTEYDESLRLEEDDLDFIPTSDLAYNEFMPEGPSGYQVDDESFVNDCKADSATKKAENKKIGRLGTPNFFKSPFSKSLKLRTKTKPPHESTSWEWYRSKNADTRQRQKALRASSSASSSFLNASPTQSIDSSSLSEVHFPNNHNENSFRILEEAILSSGERMNESTAATHSSTNGNDHNKNKSNGNSNISNGLSGSSSSAASNSTRSSTSSTATKKKRRSFNNIFRKVF